MARVGKQRLYCELGEHWWERSAWYGRKPRACPKHYDRQALKRLNRHERAQHYADYSRMVYRQQANGWRAGYAARIDQLARRRLRRKEAFIESVDPLELLNRYAGLCGICGLPIEGNFHVDHVAPLSKGGEHSYANTQPAHPICNRRKAAKVG
jgi:5-methylcytosine-specific restriction endonuclease McrA